MSTTFKLQQSATSSPLTSELLRTQNPSKLPMMPTKNEDPLTVAVVTASQLAQWLLRSFGVVPPTGIALIGTELEVETAFPAETSPKGASNEMLFDAVAARLNEISIKRGNLRAVATLFKPANDDHVIVQVELPNGFIAPFAFLPKKLDGEWMVEEPLPNEENDFSPVLPVVLNR